MTRTMTFHISQSMYFSSTLDFAINLFVSLSVIVVNLKYLKDLKQDDRSRPPGSNENLVKRIMSTYTKSVIIYAPAHLMLFWLLHQDVELPIWFKHGLCFEVFTNFLYLTYTGFNSFIVAGMRYTFVVHHNQLLAFGVKKTKTIFYYCSILVPLLIGMLYLSTATCPKRKMSIARSICADLATVSNETFLGLDSNVTQRCGLANLGFFSLRNQYISKETLKYMNGFTAILVMIICSNVFEGYFYWKAFAVIRRHQSREFLKEALSEQTLRMRHQKVSVNIKIQLLSWILECIPGIAFVFFFFLGFGEERLRNWYILFHITLIYVIVPSTYIMNREVTKEIIVLEDWFQGIKSIFCERNEVEPEPENIAPPNDDGPGKNSTHRNPSERDEQVVNDNQVPGRDEVSHSEVPSDIAYDISYLN